MIHFVGAGPGAPDLITVRGKQYLEEADVIIYAGSLVNPQLLEYSKDVCTIYNSAKMTLEEAISVMEKAEKKVRQRFVSTQAIPAFTERSGSRWIFWMKKELPMIPARASALSAARQAH